MNDHTTHPLTLFRYCPRCGSEHFEVHNEKSKRCAHCGFVYYFSSAAATVAVITNDRRELLVCRRAKDPAKGTLDLPGGFIDMYETGEEGVRREVREETGLEVLSADYLFSLPNIYEYSGFMVHTLDLFFGCTVADARRLEAADDVAAAFFLPLSEIHPEDFGLESVRKGMALILDELKATSPLS
ncbi:MAG: NUDIX domain-containing protein [Prevotellaceae bacterium]|jgi:mutator protein MutT|nr:NUDIX domain-containing protein [Prevotellaceae bacterium]